MRYSRVFPLLSASWVDFQKDTIPPAEVVGDEEEVLWRTPPFPSSITATVVASAQKAERAEAIASEMIDLTMVMNVEY